MSALFSYSPILSFTFENRLSRNAQAGLEHVILLSQHPKQPELEVCTTKPDLTSLLLTSPTFCRKILFSSLYRSYWFWEMENLV